MSRMIPSSLRPGQRRSRTLSLISDTHSAWREKRGPVNGTHAFHIVQPNDPRRGDSTRSTEAACDVLTHGTIQLDAVILGGGVAGLWTLDELTRRGYAVLLIEREALGAGQTVASQGIIHGGLKYSLAGLFSESARAIRDMPLIWRECLAGQREPRLTGTTVRSQFCHLWNTESVSSRLGMIGAKVGLRIRPVEVAPQERPPVLRDVPGTVARLDEQVIDPVSLMGDLLARNHARVIGPVPDSGIGIVPKFYGVDVLVQDGSRSASIHAPACIFAAGAGNADLRRLVDLPVQMMQRRPLHMVMARGERLPILNGHCVDGRRTRVTITSASDSVGRVIWQVGGQIAEDGVTMDEATLIAHACREIHEALGGFDPGPDVEWATYRVDRAEAATGSGVRPDDVFVRREGPFITAWPTKLALAPRVAERIAEALDRPRGEAAPAPEMIDWPRPPVAPPPWETAPRWIAATSAIRV